ncbi:hypothetical protein BHE74_00056609, partial [Ensete ventricosum]
MGSTYRSTRLPVLGPSATGWYCQKSTVGGRLREKSIVGGRLREKLTVSGRLRKKKGSKRRGKEEKRREEIIPWHPCSHAVVARPSPALAGAFSPARGERSRRRRLQYRIVPLGTLSTYRSDRGPVCSVCTSLIEDRYARYLSILCVGMLGTTWYISYRQLGTYRYAIWISGLQGQLVHSLYMIFLSPYVTRFYLMVKQVIIPNRNVFHTDLYRPVWVVRTGPPGYRYADCSLPGVVAKIDHRRSIEGEKGKKKKRKRRKKKEEEKKKEYLAPSSPARRRCGRPARRCRPRSRVAREPSLACDFSPTRGERSRR